MSNTMTIDINTNFCDTNVIFFEIDYISFANGYQIDDNLFNIARLFPNLRILDMYCANVVCHSFGNKLNNMKMLEEVKFPSECSLMHLDGTFKGCEHLRRVDLGHMPYLISMKGTFEGCKELEIVEASGVFGDLLNMESTFRGCSNYSPKMLPFIAPNLAIIHRAFMGTAVTSFEFRTMVVEGGSVMFEPTEIDWAFADCELLESLSFENVTFDNFDNLSEYSGGFENLLKGSRNFKILKINDRESWGPTLNYVLMTDCSGNREGCATMLLGILKGDSIRDGVQPTLHFD